MTHHVCHAPSRRPPASPALFISCLVLASCAVPIKLGELTEAEVSGTPEDEVTDTLTGGDSPTSDISTQAIDSVGGESSSGETSSSGGPACTEVTVTRTPVRPNVVLVLDKSSSMVSPYNGMWDHDADPGTPEVTRWWSLHAVVTTLLTDFDAAINFGAHLFPGKNVIASYDEDACRVSETIDVAVAASNKAAVLAEIPTADDVTLKGGTPTTAGILAALEHLSSLDPAVPRAIVLVTDGAANCGAGSVPPGMFEDYDESVHTVVTDAFTQDQIPTYVVGVGIEDVTTPTVKDGTPDGVNTFARLNDLADEGGKPRADPDEKFYNTINQIELAAALDQIAVDSLTCIITLDPVPASPIGTAIAVGGMPVAQISDCASESGWKYTDAQAPFDTIELCGSACAGLKIAGSAEVTVCTAD